MTIEEYESVYGTPERWTRDFCEFEYISKLQLKQNGFFVYWKKERECSDGDLRKVKVYTRKE